MEYIKRIFKYVWPQWPRIIIVTSTAILISILFSLSFLTLIPILKVMMGQEGLHGYVDRKVCGQRYGMEFYVPDKIDYANPDVLHDLLITGVERKSLAEKAGLKPQYRIVGITNSSSMTDVERNLSSELLKKLAKASPDDIINIKYKRPDDTRLYNILFDTGKEPFYLPGLTKLMSYIPVQVTAQDKTHAMVRIVMLVGIFTIIRCIATFFQKYYAHKITEVAIMDLRKELFGHVIDLPVGFFESGSPSDIVSRLLNDTGQLSIGIKIMLGKALRDPLNALVMLGTAMAMDFKLTLIFLAGAPATVYAVARLGKRIKRATKKSLISRSQMLGKLKETFSTIKIVKVYNQQEHENNSFGNINNSLLKQLLKIAKINAATGPIMESLGLFAGCAALLFGVYWVVQAQIDATEFLVLIGLLGAAADSVRKSSGIWNKIQQANAAGQRVYSVIDQSLEFEKPDAVELPKIKGNIEFKDVVFTYPGSESPVLNGINLSVKAGHNVAIVGPNGSGKTTVVNLLPKFYRPDSGSITIDGYDIGDCTLKSLREKIAMVTQNVFTFNDTIAANIAYAKQDAAEEEIKAAAYRAYADEFISELPDGYNTIIGEESTGLSGGQLQRIVIARAILKDPAILIFDEATSQIDADSEAKIHKAIEDIMKQRTSFIIAHRFSTIINADVIVVMNDGKIIDQGQHDKLIKSCALYQSLYETQLVKA